MKRVLTISVLLALGAAGTPWMTDISTAAPFSSEDEAAYDYAAEYWGATPTLCTSIEKVALPPEEIFEEAGGRATRPTYPTACRIEVNVYLSGSALCPLMLHEYLHLLGYEHDDPPFSDPEAFKRAPRCEGLRRAENRASAWDNWRSERMFCNAEKGQRRIQCDKTLRHWKQRLKKASAPQPTQP